MRSDEFSGFRAVTAERLDELAVACVEHEPIAILRVGFRTWPVTISDHDVAVWCRTAGGGLQERVGAGLRDTGLAQRQQQLAVLIELEDLIALHAGHAGRIRERSAVDRPQVAVSVLT